MPLIRDVSDTARWVAIYRAIESERPDALFHDRWARGLAGERGQAIADGLPRGASSGWAMVVRTAVMDEIVEREVAAGVDTLVDIADPKLLAWLSKRTGKLTAEGGAPFRFAPASNTAFFEPFGWREREYRSTFTEAVRLRRTMRFFWLVALRSLFTSAKRKAMYRRFSGYALLERR